MLVTVVLSFLSIVALLRRLHVIKTFTKKDLLDFIFLEIFDLPFREPGVLYFVLYPRFLFCEL